MSQSKEIILNSLCRNVTTRAKIAFLLISAERALKTIEGKVSTIYPENSNEANEIYEWFSSALNDGWIWLTNLEMKGKAYYEKYFIDQPPIYTGYYEYRTQPQEERAFNGIRDALFYVCYHMLDYEMSKTGQNTFIYSDIAEVDEDIVLECLESIRESSKDEQIELAWQEKVITQLLQDHYTEEFDVLGELIGKEYFEQFS